VRLAQHHFHVTPVIGLHLHVERIVHVALKTKDSRQVARGRLTNTANTALGTQLGKLLIVVSDHTTVVGMVPGAVSFESATDAI
jgi:hypothetical protein